MTSKVLKIAPLFFILLMTFSAIAYTPTATTVNSTMTSPQIHANYAAIGSVWVNNSNAYATYNGHFGERAEQYLAPSNETDLIMTANLTVTPRPSDGNYYSNLSVSLYEFFTGSVIPNMEGLWYNISTTTGLVAHTKSPDPPTLQGHPSFFYVPQVAHKNFGQTIVISTPYNQTALTFTVIRFETVLGIQTKLLAASWNYFYSMGPQVWSSHGAINLWVSNDSTGLLMRIKGSGHDTYNNYPYYRYHDMDMSMEIGKTNIVDLVPPSIPESIVGWMGVGKYIQYNLQGSGYIDASIIDHTGGVTWALPGDTKFRTTVSANVTMKVTKGTTAWVDPWNSTRYMWVVHLMLNNTQLLLPDLDRTIKYVNQTLGMPVPYPESVAYIESILAPFNHTGPVADTWFLVDNATGIMLWPGIHLGALSTYSPSAGEELGDLLSQGLGFEILSYFAQSILHQDWSISNPPSTQTISGSYKPYDQKYTRTTSGTAKVSLTDVGTTYLNFPGGGGGHCWQLKPSVNVHVTESTMLNRTGPAGYPYGTAMGYLMENGTYAITTSGNSYIDIERTTGFPLAMDLQTTFTLNSEARALPYFWLSAAITVFIDLSATVPKTNIWFSNPPVRLIAGLGGNVTTPPGYFGDYGFDVWMSGAHNVSVTSSVSPPPDSGTTPPGTLPFIYLDVKGIPTGGSAIILYVYYNRTKVSQLGLDENSLKLYAWNYTSSAWNALETTHLVINSTHGVLFAVLPHLSYFAVLGSPSTGGGGIPTTYILIAAVAVIVVLAAVVFMKRRRGGIK